MAVEDCQGLVCREDLRIDNLLICLQVVSSAGTDSPFPQIPHTGCPALSIVESGPIRPDRCWLVFPSLCCGQHLLLLLHYNPAWKRPAPAPLLALHRFSRPKSRGCPGPVLGHRLVPLQGLLGSSLSAGSGRGPLGKTGLAVIGRGHCRCQSALSREDTEWGGPTGSQAGSSHSVNRPLVLALHALPAVPGELGCVREGALNNGRLEIPG